MSIELIRRAWKNSVLSAIGFLALATQCQLADKNEKYYPVEKISGVSFVAANEPVTEKDFIPIQALGATWVSLMPYGFVSKTAPVVQFNSPGQWYGETSEGLLETVRLCKQEGLRVMVKPQIWLRHGEYTGTYLPPDSAMAVFENSFADFVLEYARIADEIEADMFCIGTEWQKFIVHDPEFWQRLIVRVKNIYSGPLTYAANWDEYKSTPFWPALDYIGVNAYFPLSNEDHPTIEDLKQGWQPWVKGLISVAEVNTKPILFTEYGYRSTVKNASKPWESYSKPEVSLANQKIAYLALYEEIWGEPWFAGGFAWKWFHNHEQRGGKDHIGFSPQNKPAQEAIRSVYSQRE